MTQILTPAPNARRAPRNIDVMAMTDLGAWERSIMDAVELVPDVDEFVPEPSRLPVRLTLIQGGAARPFAHSYGYDGAA